jgi:hypothetical protein
MPSATGYDPGYGGQTVSRIWMRVAVWETLALNPCPTVLVVPLIATSEPARTSELEPGTVSPARYFVDLLVLTAAVAPELFVTVSVDPFLAITVPAL